MTIQEMKRIYKKTLKELSYINKRIEHEQKKEIEFVTIKVSGSSREFPYLPDGLIVEAEEPNKATKKVEKIINWEKEVQTLHELQRKVEEQIDKIEDIETREIIWKYCVEGKTQNQIAEETGYTRTNITKKIKKLSHKFT